MWTSLLSLLVFQVLVFQAFGQSFDGACSENGEGLGPGALALGGTGRAAVDPASPNLNPASIAHLNGYFITLRSCQYQKEPLRKSLVLADHSPDSIVAGSLVYSEPNSWNLALANYLGLVTSAGIAIRKTKLGENKVLNFDLGLLHAARENFGIGLVAYNLSPSSFQKISWGGGVNYIFHEFLKVRFDIVQELDAVISQLGLESQLNQWFALRFGTSSNNLNSFGVGFVGPKFWINYSYIKSTFAESSASHSIDLVLPLW